MTGRLRTPAGSASRRKYYGGMPNRYGCYNRRVKKLLLLLLLAVLPIQASWAMAAVYCQHEASKASHYGHHGHEHQAQPDDDGDGDGDGAGAGKSKPSQHGDCEVCHHALQASVPAGEAVLAPTPAAAYAAPGALHYHSFIADGPPRPNWWRRA